MASPPARTSKTKNKGEECVWVTLFSRKFLGHVLRIYVCASEFFWFWLFWLWFFTKDTLYNFAVDGYNSKLLLLLLRGGGGTNAILLFHIHLWTCAVCLAVYFLSSSVHFTHISFSQILLFGPHLLAFKPFTNLKNASNSLPNTP